MLQGNQQSFALKQLAAIQLKLKPGQTSKIAEVVPPASLLPGGSMLPGNQQSVASGISHAADCEKLLPLTSQEDSGDASGQPLNAGGLRVSINPAEAQNVQQQPAVFSKVLGRF